MRLLSIPINRQYYAPFGSLSHILTLWFKSCIILLPFFLSYYGKSSIWSKVRTFREQPQVQYTHQILVLAHVLSNESGQYKDLYFSTIDSNDNIDLFDERSFRMCQVISKEQDLNQDGLNDELNLNLNLPLMENESLISFQMLIFMDIQFKDRSKFHIRDALACIDCSGGSCGKSFTTFGDLMFRQDSILDITKLEYAQQSQVAQHVYGKQTTDTDARRLTHSYEMYRDENGSSLSLPIPQILHKYLQRNYNTYYKQLYAHYEPTSSSQHDDFFTIKIHMKYPSQEIYYIPTFTEVIQDAWIQYLSIFIIVWFLAKRILTFLLDHQM